MHTTKCTYGNRQIVVIHNGDWSGECYFKVFPYDVDDPRRYDNAEPLVDITLDGYHVIHFAIQLVGDRLRDAVEAFTQSFLSTERRLGKPNLFDLLTRGPS